MKQHFLFTFTLALIITASNAQEPQPEKTHKTAKNYFYLSPFNLIASQFLIGYERDIKEKHGIAVLPGIILDNQYYYGTDFGASVELQYRYRIVTSVNPRGKAKNDFRFNFYFAPFAGYQYLDFEDDYSFYDYSTNTWQQSGESLSIHAVSGGILFGTKFTFFERFSIDTYAGGGVKYSDKKANYWDIFRQGYTGIIGRANLQIGVAF